MQADDEEKANALRRQQDRAQKRASYRKSSNDPLLENMSSNSYFCHMDF